MAIIKQRTFEAKQYPKDSKKRKELNGDVLTSEYMPSYRYIRIEDSGIINTYRTKREAENG